MNILKLLSGLQIRLSPFFQIGAGIDSTNAPQPLSVDARGRLLQGVNVVNTTVLNATANGNIPAGATNWKITAVSGTVAVAGQALPNGSSFSGGSGALQNAIAYTIAAGVALVSYDTPV